jgi:hypothetical protein
MTGKSRLSSLAVLTLAAFGAPASANANPQISEWSDQVDYDQAACVDHARAAFAQEGWDHVAVANKWVVSADKGGLSGLIVCLYSSDSQADPVVFVAGGDGDLGSNEGLHLKHDMFGK